MQSPLVSVVIPTHDRPELVRRALASVLAQTYAGPIECVIVHDKEPADRSLDSGDPWRSVRVIENDHTPGLAGARNAGLAVARGDILASLDDDDYWTAEKVAAQVACLLADEDLLVVATGTILHTAGRPEAVREPPGPRVTHRELLRSRVADLHSSNLLMRRRAFDLVGGYDEELVGEEDYDWLLRVSRHYPVAVVQQPMLHVFRDTPLWRPQRWERIARAREQVLARHPDLGVEPAGAAVFYGKLAFAYAAAGNRANALRWAGRAMRQRVVNPWALIAVLIVTVHLPVRWVQKGANLTGRSI